MKKLLLTSAMCLLIGGLVGFYIEHTRGESNLTEAIKLMQEAEEAIKVTEAARSAKAISLLASGESQDAIALLCGPITSYSVIYAKDSETNELRLKLRALIEDLVRTNEIVANEMRAAMSNR